MHTLSCIGRVLSAKKIANLSNVMICKHEIDYDHLWRNVRPRVIKQLKLVASQEENRLEMHISSSYHVFTTDIISFQGTSCFLVHQDVREIRCTLALFFLV